MVDEQYEQLQQERTTSIVQPGHATEANPCLDRVQWPELLAGRDMRVLTPLVLLPDQTEDIL